MTAAKPRKPRSPARPPADPAAAWRRALSARLYRNRKAAIVESNERGARVEVPLQPHKGLLAPISWLLRPKLTRSVQLDPLGAEVLELCRDGARVEDVVDAFAAKRGLSFHEARVSVTQLLKGLVERGVLVLALDKPAPSQPQSDAAATGN